jgi:secreted trypsin-like serine protease
MIEISQPNFDFCSYHEGGPLIVRDVNGADGDVIVGIVSWGIGCGIMPGVFAQVSSGYDWIQVTVCKSSNDPPGSLCDEPTNSPTTQRPTRSKWMIVYFYWACKVAAMKLTQ